ncbi:MAG: 3,4-dihydroxy-2-butanone-4-phosphate synthase [Phycisphaeraceae bacterium]|nr:3,4-dihydroxy-2-butanone-4-phosphate synthase [Phycisphaeraceae bacterium]
MPLSPIPDILEDLRAGRVIVLVDDEDRENEGDFVCAAEKLDIATLNFMTRIGGGYLCVSLDGETCDRLDLGPQTAQNTSLRGTPFTVSVDGHPRHGVGTGISAADRVKTIRMLVDASSRPDDFVRPGHINPLRARDGGVLVRTGQTEGSVDLCRLAGLSPAAVIIEVVREDGEMARVPDLERLCTQHGLRMCSVEQIIEWRLAREALIERMEPLDGSEIATPEGPFRLFAWQSSIDALPHLALTLGGIGVPVENGRIPEVDEPVLVRMHRREILGDVFGVSFNGGDPGQETIRRSLRAIRREGRGALVYLRSEGSGFDLPDRIQRIRRRAGRDVNAPDLLSPDGIGAKAQPMDLRHFGIGGQILRDLGLRRLRLLSNHPRSLPGLHGFGLEVSGFEALA